MGKRKVFKCKLCPSLCSGVVVWGQPNLAGVLDGLVLRWRPMAGQGAVVPGGLVLGWRPMAGQGVREPAPPGCHDRSRSSNPFPFLSPLR